MGLIVQKFGGTSVADSQKILAAARKAVRAFQEGNQVVVVVSAMGKNTDLLISLAQEITEQPPAREMDMLLSTGEQVSVALMAMAIHALGYHAVSLTGAQIGIKTDSTHTKARIQSISTERVRQSLEKGNIVIAAGFQGIDENYDITTLGRGGSDTTAVALAAVLEADACEVYTDVDGVYTTDPRLLPEARRVSRISYDEMLELASLGASVMHNRAVEFAKKFTVPIHVRSSFTDAEGTMIADVSESPDRPVVGAAAIPREARISLLGVPDLPGTSATVFSKIAARNVTVDMIVQNVGSDGVADISFTVPRDEMRVTLDAVQEAASELSAEGFTHDDQVAKISVVGREMARQTGVAQKMFRTLADAELNLQMISTSEIKISTLVESSVAQTALRALHDVFELHQPPPVFSDPPVSVEETRPQDAARDRHIVQRLQHMEDLAIEDIALDETQARISINQVPDTPGVAAGIFERIATANIFVDMIVQSMGRDQRASLSFTVPRDHAKAALDITRQLSQQFGCGSVDCAAQVAKLSVSGIGMRSHTGVAVLMFQTLAREGINVEMINTSEIRVNVVVDGGRGTQAREALQTALQEFMD